MKNRCKHCHEIINGGSHYCSQTGHTYSDNGGDFLLSAAIAAATDSAIIGGLIGGDMLGGVVGDLLDGDLFD